MFLPGSGRESYRCTTTDLYGDTLEQQKCSNWCRNASSFQRCERSWRVCTEMCDLQTKQAWSTCSVWSTATIAGTDQTMAVSSDGLHCQATAIGRSGHQGKLWWNHGGDRSILQVWAVHTVPGNLNSDIEFQGRGKKPPPVMPRLSRSNLRSRCSQWLFTCTVLSSPQQFIGSTAHRFVGSAAVEKV